eukprot:1195583-Prorocentrum_minimum.AAC.8
MSIICSAPPRHVCQRMALHRVLWFQVRQRFHQVYPDAAESRKKHVVAGIVLELNNPSSEVSPTSVGAKRKCPAGGAPTSTPLRVVALGSGELKSTPDGGSLACGYQTGTVCIVLRTAPGRLRGVGGKQAAAVPMESVSAAMMFAGGRGEAGSRCAHGDCLSLEGRVVQDSHAEVVARRSLVRWLYHQVGRRRLYSRCYQGVLNIGSD